MQKQYRKLYILAIVAIVACVAKALTALTDLLDLFRAEWAWSLGGNIGMISIFAFPVVYYAFWAYVGMVYKKPVVLGFSLLFGLFPPIQAACMTFIVTQFDPLPWLGALNAISLALVWGMRIANALFALYMAKQFYDAKYKRMAILYMFSMIPYGWLFANVPVVSLFLRFDEIGEMIFKLPPVVMLYLAFKKARKAPVEE